MIRERLAVSTSRQSVASISALLGFGVCMVVSFLWGVAGTLDRRRGIVRDAYHSCATRYTPISSATMFNALKSAREKKGLSVRVLAEKVDTHPQNYYRIEAGDQVPKPPLARRIYEFFGGSIDLGHVYDPTYVPPAALKKNQRRPSP